MSGMEMVSHNSCSQGRETVIKKSPKIKTPYARDLIDV